MRHSLWARNSKFRTLTIKGSQRDVVFLGWPKAHLYEPKCLQREPVVSEQTRTHEIFPNPGVPIGCQGWVVMPKSGKKCQNHCTLLYTPPTPVWHNVYMTSSRWSCIIYYFGSQAFDRFWIIESELLEKRSQWNKSKNWQQETKTAEHRIDLIELLHCYVQNYIQEKLKKIIYFKFIEETLK
jgi:hypothetical protein